MRRARPHRQLRELSLALRRVEEGRGDEARPLTIQIKLSTHAIERYRERVKPWLGRKQARRDLERIAQTGRVTDTSPPWFYKTPGKASTLYLEIADLVLPLQPSSGPLELIATTCIVPGSATRRTKRRRKQRAPRHRDRDAARTRRRVLREAPE